MKDMTFMGDDGRLHNPTDSDYGRQRINHLERRLSDVTAALVNVQNRLTRLDGEDLPWPADRYEPVDTEPA
jgi:hypothetical protein